MGKVRTRFLGIDEIEVQQKKEQKERAELKKIESKDTQKEAPEVEEKKVEKKSKVKKVISSSQKKHGSKHQKARTQVDERKEYELGEAIALLKKLTFAKFDETVELHLNMEKDGIRGEVSLPHATGKVIRVLVLDDKVLKDIEDGTINFDVLVAHPSQMPKIAKYARTLGPKGLMPNPKAGTVSTDPEAAAEKFKTGSLRWKTEPKAPIIHQMIGKISADAAHLEENASAFLTAVGTHNILSGFIAATMTPSIKLKIVAE